MKDNALPDRIPEFLMNGENRFVCRGAGQDEHSPETALGRMLGTLCPVPPLPTPALPPWAWRWGRRAKRGQKSRANTLFRETLKADLLIPKMATALCVCGGFEKKKQFLWPETRILSQEWVSDFHLARQSLEIPNILNKYISFLCLIYSQPSFLLFKLSVTLCP